MTYRPASQQGLVLYQSLGGKAWIAAEELSVPRLASDGGVSYFVSWITEYDRLHARLREVGCSLPQECAAWLYIDRLQLEEAQELNLLASVGNEYNLHRLQHAGGCAT